MAMTSLAERLVGKGSGQDIKYENESVHNALSISQNAVVITAPVIVPQPTVPPNPLANLLYTLLKASNSLVIK